MSGNRLTWRAKSRANEHGSGYKAVSLDECPKQHEVQVAEHDETVDPMATRDESYHSSPWEVSPAWNRGEERHAGKA